jgi:hypothetical protein
MPRPRPTPLVTVILALTAILAACGGTAATASSVPSASAATPPESAPVGTVQLNVAPANLGCDAMGVPYRSLTIRIDPAAADQVTALTDDNAPLKTFWSAGFVGGPLDDPVVLDPDGNVVARDGEVVVIPDGQWPRLHGFFVCPSPDAIYVLLTDPA